jgi:hypothetical protein
MNPNAFACRGWVCASLKIASQILGMTLVLFSISPPVFSQANQGTIQGGVFDQTGGAIAGATVTVTDVARGVTRALTTDNAGQYVAPSLNPGTYTIRAEAKGFRSAEHSGVLIEVGQNIRLDLTVQPGEQTQTVTVTGEVPAIDTTDATLGGTVSNDSINALPLNGRNFERLLQLRPGVVTAVGTGSGQTSTNGRRQGQDLLLVEGIAQIGQSGGVNGIMNVVYRGGDSSSLLPIDAIQEFNTEQNPKAEYGLKDGSVVNVGIKSGTNSLHGTAYAFGRDSQATDAGNFFSTPGVNPVTPATVEQFGATAGGRIIKDKLFWFASYEGLRTTLGDIALDTIPADVSMTTPGNPAGNPAFSMVDACNAVGRVNVNPLSAQLAGLPPGSCVPQPASSTFENLFPFTTNTTTTGNFAPGLTTTGPLNNGLFKGDYIPGPHHHLNGMVYISKTSQTVNAAAGELLPQWNAAVTTNIQMYEGAWTWTPGSSWVNDLRMGYSFLDDLTLPGDVKIIPANPWPNGYGMNTGVDVANNPFYGGLPQITFGGFSGYLGEGSRQSHRGPEGDVNLVETVSYLRGKHAFKFGFDYIDIIFDGNTFTTAQGVAKFTATKTASSLQTFLTGNPSGGSILLGNPQTNIRSHWYGGFIQDDWRLTTRLTLNLGIRYDYATPPVERNNYIGGFNPNVSPATTAAVQQVGPGAPISSLYNGDHRDFSPRLGVAWDVKGNGKTVVRAGASLIRISSTLETLVGTVPFGANFPDINVNNSGTAINAHTPVQLSVAAASFNWNLAGPVFPSTAPQTIVTNGVPVQYSGVTCTAKTPCSTNNVDPNYRQPGAIEWNLDVQRAITGNLTVDAAYVGNHGYKEASWVDLNQPAIGTGWNTPWTAAQLAAAKLGAAGDAGLTSAQMCLGQGPAPFCSVNTAAELGPYSAKFPYLNYIIQAGNGEISNYDALQVTVNERLAYGLRFLAGYSYAHALDEYSARGPAALPMDPNGTDFRTTYGNSSSDIRHRFTFSPSYNIPGMKSPGQMLQGWTLSGILTLQSGQPWSPIDATSNDLLGTGEFNSQPNIGGVYQAWNYAGPRSAFKSGPISIPLLKGNAATAACGTAAQAPYAGNAQLQGLALASLSAFGCYVQGGGILTPPAYGTVGNSGRNVFGSPAYYNVDFSVSKIWTLKERYSAQFRAEFFNLFNRADFPIPATPTGTDPSRGQFGCSCTTPDVNNPVLGSGGPRHIQFGLKLTY